MSTYFQFPNSIPIDGQVCYIRAYYYFGVPFLATFDEANQKFVSYIHPFDFPVYVVAAWRPASNYNLIVNGNFVNESDWTVDSPNYISGGKCFLPADNEQDVYQFLDLIEGYRYYLGFDISDCSGESSIKFTNAAYNSLFAAPYGAYNVIKNGSYLWEVTIANDSSRFLFYKTYADPGFAITNIRLIPR
jgi:hypothetical protein